MAKGKRLTCPLCRDSSFFTLEFIEASGGRVQCSNHYAPVEMVDLLALYEILARGVDLVEEGEPPDLQEAVEYGLIHPDDFEFGEVDYG